MPIARTWLLALALLAGRGEAQSCRPELQGIAHNLAKGRPACQSSIYPHVIIGAASKAVDGNCGGDWFKDGTCTHTQQDTEPWWYVDLGDQYAISAVIVKNRGDGSGKRLEGAQIRVGDSVADHGKSNPLCGTITNTSLGSITTLYCNWLKGSYVSINIPGRAEYLHVCEVEVYGTKMEDQC
ncbi:fucolectin-like [Rhineura floridana]|uniref:fucolectin-like n=1 Tax=Rhineura floridana TaxID=261503 RepID=UPI002AC869F4|nr:fucolectin-like [Rhineura floridana]